MLTLFDLGDNIRNEYANTPDVIQEDIRKKYSEDNLMFVMTGNRMNGCICTYAFVKNGKIKRITIEWKRESKVKILSKIKRITTWFKAKSVIWDNEFCIMV